MKKLILMLLASFSLTAYGQYITDESSFSKTYTQIRSFDKQDSLWVYAGGDFKEWTFVFNVDFFTYPGGPEMDGLVMEDDKGEPQFMMNYLGDLFEGKDDYGEYGSYKVDILSKEDDGTWRWWDSGECRYYGPWVILDLGNMYFSYFNEK